MNVNVISFLSVRLMAMACIAALSGHSAGMPVGTTSEPQPLPTTTHTVSFSGSFSPDQVEYTTSLLLSGLTSTPLPTPPPLTSSTPTEETAGQPKFQLITDSTQIDALQVHCQKTVDIYDSGIYRSYGKPYSYVYAVYDRDALYEALADAVGKARGVGFQQRDTLVVLKNGQSYPLNQPITTVNYQGMTFCSHPLDSLDSGGSGSGEESLSDGLIPISSSSTTPPPSATIAQTSASSVTISPTPTMMSVAPSSTSTMPTPSVTPSATSVPPEPLSAARIIARSPEGNSAPLFLMGKNSDFILANVELNAMKWSGGAVVKSRRGTVGESILLLQSTLTTGPETGALLDLLDHEYLGIIGSTIISHSAEPILVNRWVQRMDVLMSDIQLKGSGHGLVLEKRLWSRFYDANINNNHFSGNEEHRPVAIVLDSTRAGSIGAQLVRVNENVFMHGLGAAVMFEGENLLLGYDNTWEQSSGPLCIGYPSQPVEGYSWTMHFYGNRKCSPNAPATPSMQPSEPPSEQFSSTVIPSPTATAEPDAGFTAYGNPLMVLIVGLGTVIISGNL